MNDTTTIDTTNWPERANLQEWANLLGLSRNSLHRRVRRGQLTVTRERVSPFSANYYTMIRRRDILQAFQLTEAKATNPNQRKRE